jgi:hypothetical protein
MKPRSAGHLHVRTHMASANRSIIFASLLTASALLSFGCQRFEPPIAMPVPGASSVQIVSVSPEISQPLHSGEKIKMAVKVNYTLTEDSGTLALVVQSADNSSISSNFEVVTKGSASLTLESEFVVPSTKAVMIFTPLSGQGQSSTSIVDTRAFKVVAK